jgi:hypothetical protein
MAMAAFNVGARHQFLPYRASLTNKQCKSPGEQMLKCLLTYSVRLQEKITKYLKVKVAFS